MSQTHTQVSALSCSWVAGGGVVGYKCWGEEGQEVEIFRQTASYFPQTRLHVFMGAQNFKLLLSSHPPERIFQPEIYIFFVKKIPTAG